VQIGPFRHAIFRDIWLASLVSNFGGLIQSVGAAWLMVSLHASASVVTLVQAATTLPIMLLSLVAGAIADNYDRRRLMFGAQLFLLVVSVALALTSYSGLLDPILLLAFTFLIGCGTAFNGPAWQSLVGEMVPRSEIPAAVAMNSVGFNIARSVGPAIGGAVVAAFGAVAAFAANAFSYIGLLFVLARWRPAKNPSPLPPEQLTSAMAAGLRYVLMSPRIGVVLLRGAAFGSAAIAVQALLPLVARDLVRGGPVGYGVLLGGFGMGAVGGAFMGGELRRRSIPGEWIVRVAFAGAALGAFTLGFSHTMVLSLAAMVVAGASWVLALSSFNASVQLSAPRWVVGRALALYQMATFGGMTLGSWLWGLVADHGGTGVALYASAGALVAGACLGFAFRMPDTIEMNLDPRGWDEPMIALDIRPRSGPIVVTIQYVIRPEDVLEFLNAMASRRRIRIRDGARNWTLLRDLADPTLWVERYDTPTWQEYIRHNSRLTQSDAAVSETLRRLHQGAEPPRVRRLIERQTTLGASLDMTMEPHQPTRAHHGRDALGRTPFDGAS
jgi:MFS family permease